MDRITHNKYVKDRFESLIVQGICGKCGKRLIYRTSKRFCKVCLDKLNSKSSLYREQNPDKVALSKKNSVSKNPEKYRAIKKRFWERNKPTWTHYSRERRARKLQVGGKFSNKEWKDLLKFYGNKCIRCGSTDKLEPDHVIPISKGGRNSIDNIQPLCMSCNRAKHDKTIDFRPFGNVILEWT